MYICMYLYAYVMVWYGINVILMLVILIGVRGDFVGGGCACEKKYIRVIT